MERSKEGVGRSKEGMERSKEGVERRKEVWRSKEGVERRNEEGTGKGMHMHNSVGLYIYIS